MTDAELLELTQNLQKQFYKDYPDRHTYRVVRNHWVEVVEYLKGKYPEEFKVEEVE